jgi:hypothetical protein
MWKIILVNFLFLLGSVEIYCAAADNNSKIVCYYDSRAFAKEGEQVNQLSLLINYQNQLFTELK